MSTVLRAGLKPHCASGKLILETVISRFRRMQTNISLQKEIRCPYCFRSRTCSPYCCGKQRWYHRESLQAWHPRSYTKNKASSALGPPALKISAGILSIPNVLLEFMAEINRWRLIKSLHDRLLRDLLESGFFNCGRPLALCRAAYSPTISESFLVFDQVRSVRRQQGGAPWSRRAIDCFYDVEELFCVVGICIVLNLLSLLLPAKVLHFLEFWVLFYTLEYTSLNFSLFDVDDGSPCHSA